MLIQQNRLFEASNCYKAQHFARRNQIAIKNYPHVYLNRIHSKASWKHQHINMTDIQVIENYLRKLSNSLKLTAINPQQLQLHFHVLHKPKTTNFKVQVQQIIFTGWLVQQY